MRPSIHAFVAQKPLVVDVKTVKSGFQAVNFSCRKICKSDGKILNFQQREKKNICNYYAKSRNAEVKYKELI